MVDSHSSTSRTRAHTRDTEPPAASPAPWPDDLDTAPDDPDVSAGRVGRPRTWIANDEPPITHPMISGVFLRGVLAGPDGEPKRWPNGEPIPVIVRRAAGKDGKPSYSIIHIGTWEVSGRERAYEISDKRGLSIPSWHLYATLKIRDAENHVNIVDIAAGDLRRQLSQAEWPESTGAGWSGKTTYLRDFTRILVMQTSTSTKIHGQGPFYFDDETPNCTLSKKPAFAARSVIFDADGEIEGIRVDPFVKNSPDYYDLTPERDITDDQIREGIELFKLAYDECPNYPSIPAAFIGQQMTAFIVAIRPEFHSAIMFTGLQGSGKTKYTARWDAIQATASRISRGPLPGIHPVINLGDRRGTGKGTGYRITKYGGYAVTMDDVLKNGDSEIRIREQSQLVRDLVSSYESGGAPLGHLDRSHDRITDRSSPALHSSVKVMSEVSLIGDSTLARLIVLPHIGDSWGSGNVFNRGIAETLSSPDGREVQHRALSAYIQWAFRRVESDLDECLAKAVAETATWEVPARTQEKYAAVLAGHFMFGRFCEAHSIDISGQITGAVTALRACAKVQANASLPAHEEFFRDVRRVIARWKIAFPGLPKLDPDGISATYGPPWVLSDEIIDFGGGIKKQPRLLPDGLTMKDLGLAMIGREETPTLNPGAKPYGYVIPPHDLQRGPDGKKRGGRPGNELTRVWHIACTKEMFEEMCAVVGSVVNRTYDAHAVMNSLRAAGLGEITKRYLTNPSKPGDDKRVWVFKTDLLKGSEGDD